MCPFQGHWMCLFQGQGHSF